jgi:hypothetical protein
MVEYRVDRTHLLELLSIGTFGTHLFWIVTPKKQCC